MLSSTRIFNYKLCLLTTLLRVSLKENILSSVFSFIFYSNYFSKKLNENNLKISIFSVLAKKTLASDYQGNFSQNKKTFAFIF